MRNRLPIRDPRTVARDIPGVLDIIFPRLSGALVAAMHRNMLQFACAMPIDEELVAASLQQRSLLFEVAVVRAERILGDGDPDDLTECVDVAFQRQRKHFDARLPADITETDYLLIQRVSGNLANMLQDFVNRRRATHLVIRPKIPGFGWIASGRTDFAVGDVLIEVKNTDRNFISGDYRQILIYWMLAYAGAIETNQPVWSKYLLINPRLNRSVYGSFDALSQAASGGLSRLEVYEYFRAIVASQTLAQK